MTDWSAAPNTSQWYGEVIVGKDGEDTDYHYGYSNDAEPDVTALVPDGWTLLESTLNATPRNPEWRG